MGRYKVTTWHGEIGTVFYVVDTAAPEEEQPAVVLSYGPVYIDAAESARNQCERLNVQEVLTGRA
jgi:hypothetical protein